MPSNRPCLNPGNHQLEMMHTLTFLRLLSGDNYFSQVVASFSSGRLASGGNAQSVVVTAQRGLSNCAAAQARSLEETLFVTHLLYVFCAVMII